MNVLEVKDKDFVKPQLDLKSLKSSYLAVAPHQHFIYFVLPNGGIYILKDRVGIANGIGVFFAE